MHKEDFEKIVEQALMFLPEEFARKLQNIEVVVEDEPSEQTLRELGLRKGVLLGLYHGVPLKKQSLWSSPVLPGRISIYRVPILAISRTTEDMIHRIREVVIHEIGHHFGLSDNDMNGRRTAPEKRAQFRQERQKRKR